VDLTWQTLAAGPFVYVPADILTAAAIGSNTVPEFPLSLFALLAIVIPLLQILRSRATKFLPV